MKCFICKQGETQDGHTTITLNRAGATIIIKEVPTQICNNCGEYYLSEEISEQVMALAENAIKHNAEVEILRFAA